MTDKCNIESLLHGFACGHFSFVATSTELPKLCCLERVTAGELSATNAFGEYEKSTMLHFRKPLTLDQQELLQRVRESDRFLIYEGNSTCRIVFSFTFLHNRVFKRLAKRSERAKNLSVGKLKTKKK
jgi:hypothetical protein